MRKERKHTGGYCGEKEAASIIGCSPRSVRRYCQAGQLKKTRKRPGVRAKFRVEDVIRFAEGE